MQRKIQDKDTIAKTLENEIESLKDELENRVGEKESTIKALR